MLTHREAGGEGTENGQEVSRRAHSPQRIEVFLTTNHPDSEEDGAGEVARLSTEFRGRSVLVDLHEVTTIDSWGIALFIEAMHRVSAYGGSLVLFGIREELREVLETAKLDCVFNICATREEALSRAARQGGSASFESFPCPAFG